MALILGIESSCDETAAAVVRDGREVLSSAVASQTELHARYRGVVPEIASRAHIENILPVIESALAQAGLGGAAGIKKVDAIAAVNRPGLIGSLLIGVTAAKTLAWAADKPLIDVDHVRAHLYSVLLDNQKQVEFPAVGVVLSGGHTALYRVNHWRDISLLGSTIDDAVGEAYDKVAALLGLGYPGGPVIDQMSLRGDGQAIAFPRSLLGRKSLDFSFSGLKTAVLYHVRGHKGRQREACELTSQQMNDVAASFQAACIDVLTIKIKRAVEAINGQSVVIGGGVSANSGLRKAMVAARVPVLMPDLAYCTDNAAMAAGLADEYFHAGQFAALDLDAVPTGK